MSGESDVLIVSETEPKMEIQDKDEVLTEIFYYLITKRRETPTFRDHNKNELLHHSLLKDIG